MGMFDTVICECPLPDSPPEGIWWQTKDFDCPGMEDYKITTEGRLLHELVRYEDHSDPNAEGLARLRGMMTPIREGWEDLSFHGVLNFYGYDHRQDGAAPYDPALWYEYNAKFTDGQLVSIERVQKPEPRSTIGEHGAKE